MAARRHPLVDRWFHSFDTDRCVVWQGRIAEYVDDQHFLVQLHEWVTGGASARVLVSLEAMRGWEFYHSSEEMNEAYKHRHYPATAARERKREKGKTA